MTQTHPITPPPELVEQWREEWEALPRRYPETCQFRYVATQAARWGADQELETILEMVGVGQQSLPEEDRYLDGFTVASIRAARRPKPPSLKEQALADLDSMSIKPCWINGIDANALVRAKYDNIRRALEALDD
jgi:hypothetical protein